MGGINAVEFAGTGIVVVDLERAERFYRDVFGMKEIGRMRTDPLEMDEVILGLPGGGASLLLIRFDDLRTQVHVGQKLVFYVPDVTAAIEAAKAAGGALIWGPEEVPELGATVAFVQDADGHWIECLDARVGAGPSVDA